jgi:predicted SAM-dependent methyltransferase
MKSLLLNLLPREVYSHIRYEVKSSAQHFKTWLIGRSKFRGRTHLKLNIGCGPNVVADWINIDVDGPSEVFRWDCRRGLPFDAGSVDLIFAEHVFEHLDPESGTKFLSECHRCLSAGGIVRIVVPDAGRYLELYSEPWSAMEPIRPLIKENGKYRDYWLNTTYRTKMEFINEIFRQGGQHKYAYDAETLIMRFRDAGFTNVKQQQFGVSEDNRPPLDTQMRRNESLYVEGIR